MIANDKIGQTLAKFDNMIDNIFKVFCGINVHKGSKFILAVYYPNTTATYYRTSISGVPLCYSILQN